MSSNQQRDLFDDDLIGAVNAGNENLSKNTVFHTGDTGKGKGLALDVKLPTPTGWTTMEKVHVGDWLIGADGGPCQITAVSDVQHRPCFQLTFDDGACLIADDIHCWLTFDTKELNRLRTATPEWRARRRSTRPSRVSGRKSEAFTASLTARNAMRAQHQISVMPTGTVRDTRTLAATLRTASGRTNHAIALAGAIELPECDLPVPPYTMGAWLGDGNSRSGGFTGQDPGILERIRADGFEVRTYTWSTISHSILKLKTHLRTAGVLGNKHIPPAYLRASITQRLALLQGLMDTDGHAALDGGSQFDNVNERLADDVLALVLSLGIKATKTQGIARLNGRAIGPKYRILFTTAQPVFGLERKAQRLNAKTRRTTVYRYLVNCQQVESVPTRCIVVNSACCQFLAGSHLVPTCSSASLPNTALAV